MRQRIGVCIVALAAAGLVVDRVFLRPGDATPDKAGAADTAAADDLPSAANSETQASEGPSLAARLRELSASEDPGSGDVRDAFRPSQAWLAVLSPPPSEAPAPAPESKPEPRKPVHQLTAVILDKTGDRAIVDGKCLGVGQELNGMKLISVAKRSAVLEFRGKRVELTLETDAQADASP